MPILKRWRYLVCIFSGFVLGGVFVHGRIELQHRGDVPMNDSRFTVDHECLVTDKPFDEVTQLFEQQLGRFDPDVYKSLAARGDTEGVKAKIEAMVGPSGFMLFGTN